MDKNDYREASSTEESFELFWESLGLLSTFSDKKKVGELCFLAGAVYSIRKSTNALKEARNAQG